MRVGRYETVPARVELHISGAQRESVSSDLDLQTSGHFLGIGSRGTPYIVRQSITNVERHSGVD